jgi:flagellar biosynthesis GTPase FlhF
MSVYRGRSVDELIPKIQHELGPDAIIVRRREGLTGGFLGFFQRPFVEIEAMAGAPRIDVYDEQDSFLAPPLTPSPAQSSPAAPLTSQPAQPTYHASPPAPPAVPAQPAAQAPAAPAPFFTREPAAPSLGASAYVTAHLAALARAERSQAAPHSFIPERQPLSRPSQAVDFQELIPPTGVRPSFIAPPTSATDSPPPRTFERRTVAPGSHARARAGVHKNLCRFGISDQLADELIDGATAHVLPFAPRAGLAQAVRTALAQRIPVAPPLPTRGAAILVVGAGGAGKTTCCAALLGAYRTGGTLPASCATLMRADDTGELEMILSPKIMNAIPASTPRAVRALRRARVDGLAVIDTPRVSPADRAGVRELSRLLGELKPDRVLVALPATLGAAAAAQLLEALAPLGANSLALTHAEETDQIGVAIEAACRFGLAPEYMLERGRSGGWRLSRVDPTGLAAKLLQ